MAKKCTEEGCDNNQFGGKKCLKHQYKRTDKKLPAHKSRKKINPRSVKRKAQEEIYYNIKRPEFLSNPINYFCNVCKTNPSIEIHHKDGREGDLLIDETTFLAVCRPCHRKIEMNNEWAKENNYSGNRTISKPK